MDSDDGKEKGGVTAVRKGEAMKSLEKATADYEKAKEKMEASKARYEWPMTSLCCLPTKGIVRRKSNWLIR